MLVWSSFGKENSLALCDLKLLLFVKNLLIQNKHKIFKINIPLHWLIVVRQDNKYTFFSLTLNSPVSGFPYNLDNFIVQINVSNILQRTPD